MAILTSLRPLARRLIPFRVRRELVCLRRLPQWIAERGTIAAKRADASEHGFERVAVRRMTLPSRRYASDEEGLGDSELGIERAKLSRRFARATDDDLRTAAAHYLFRKPA